MRQITKDEAILISDKKLYEDWSYEKKAKFQMNQEKLCMPFPIFHEALEKTLGRSVFTHELALNYDGIKNELREGK